jgi:hypothetical protein
MIKKSNRPQIQASVAPRLNDSWFRPSRCVIEGEDIVSEEELIWYSPVSIKALPAKFGGITEATGAIRFVSEYGPPELPQGSTRPGLSMGVSTFPFRVSIKSFLEEAKKVRRIRRAVALSVDTRSEIQENLTSHLVDLYGLKMPISPSPQAAARHLSAAQTKHVVDKFILQELNKYLPQSCEQAQIGVNGEFESVLSFESLLALIYRFQFEELQRGRLRLCLECGTVFEWTDPRQMFCSKRCGLDLAQRRHRKRRI